MADVVEREDVNEAMRLMEMSKQSLYDDEQASRWVWSLRIFFYCSQKKFTFLQESASH